MVVNEITESVYHRLLEANLADGFRREKVESDYCGFGVQSYSAILLDHSVRAVAACRDSFVWVSFDATDHGPFESDEDLVELLDHANRVAIESVTLLAMRTLSEEDVA